MKIDEAYDIWADIYDTNENKTRDLELVSTKSYLENKHFSKIIELGCGTGKNSEWLVDKCDTLLAVDFSSKMLEKAMKKISSRKVQFIQIDILNEWKFADNSADLVTSSLLLEHIQNLDFIFSQVHKSLNKNGLFYICELHPIKQYSGSKARFELDGKVVKLETYIHHVSEYFESASKNNFKFVEINEWFDDEENVVPRLISFLFQKVN